MESHPVVCRCLIAEDNRFAADLLATYLERNGILSDLAENGRIGLDRYLEEPTRYDLILVDIQMPVMDGFEMARLIRESGTANAESIPIIAMSGSSHGDQGGVRLVNRFVKKPFELPALLALVREEAGL